MKLKTLLLGLTLGLFSMIAIAGSGHDHGHSHEPVNQENASSIATKIVANFIKQKTLDKSWESTTVSSSEKKMFNGKQEWVVSFENEKVTDAKKRKLYIFLTLSGDYIAANYTGK
ncbi:MAG: DUF6488 family protein [Gammaproteobacteria bacterium]|nr:DUF6488 family protein [Gammaproteobacteria bacterium]MCW8986999.1 DUF6488 family protein [Gammaproteobacteria bacterium]MCW9030469.1 DUF6488 family protein [Gammaproteobacteria bacterium]